MSKFVKAEVQRSSDVRGDVCVGIGCDGTLTPPLNPMLPGLPCGDGEGAGRKPCRIRQSGG